MYELIEPTETLEELTETLWDMAAEQLLTPLDFNDAESAEQE